MSNTKRRVAILESIFGNADIERAVLEPHGYEVSYHHALSEDEIITAARGACAILLETAHITPRVLDALPEVRVISRYGVGYDTINVEAATARGVAVMNVPDYCMDEVAEHAIALMFALTRGVVDHNSSVRSGTWVTNRYGVRTLVGRNFGIVGLGRIGKAAAWRAAGLGMNVLAYDIDPVPLPGVRVKFTASLEELLAQADVVSLHVPLISTTRNLIGAKELALMKPDAILINTARGPVVNQEALVEALQNGRIAGAAADVHTTEPIPADSPLFGLPHFIITTHIAYHSPDSMIKMRHIVAQNIADFYDGKGDSHIVNGIRHTKGD